MLDPLKTGDLVARMVMRNFRIRPSDPADLTLTGLLYLYDATKNEEYLNHVLKVWDFRKTNNCDILDVRIYSSCLHFETWLRTGDNTFINGFEAFASDWKKSIQRNSDGIVCTGSQPDNLMMSAGFLQGYCTFMSRAGFLTGNVKFFEECTRQFELSRQLHRDPSTGLWTEGKIQGFGNLLNPMSFTSRAQGWILRGLADSIDWLPEDSIYLSRLKTIFIELCKGLSMYQDIRGMWHQLTDHEEAYQETSGTALIVHNLYKGFHRDWLDRNPYLTIAEKAIMALIGFIREDGSVLNTGQVPSDVNKIRDYFHTPSVPGDPWSIGPALMACAGPWLAREPKSMVKS